VPATRETIIAATSDDSLRLPAGRNLFVVTSPLYQVALAAALSLISPKSDGKLDSEVMVQWMAFNLPQKPIEQALLDAHKKPIK
jgi:hypothetical protein